MTLDYCRSSMGVAVVTAANAVRRLARSSCTGRNCKLIDWLDLSRINDRRGVTDGAKSTPRRHNSEGPESSRTSGSDPVPGTSPPAISLATRGADAVDDHCSMTSRVLLDPPSSDTACCCCCCRPALDWRRDVHSWRSQDAVVLITRAL